MDEDEFLHTLAISLAEEAIQTCETHNIDLKGDGMILHLGQAFMLVLHHRSHARKV